MLRGHTFIGGFSQGPSKMIGASKRLRISAYLSASFLLIFGLLAVFPMASSVSDTSAAKKSLEQTTLSMTSSDFVTNPRVTSTNGTFASSSTDITVSTDNYTGYTIGIAAKTNDSDYSKLKSANSELNSISSATSEADFSAAAGTSFNGLWGYKPSMLESSSNTNYLPAPTFAGDELNKTNGPNQQADTYTISLGARIDLDTESGRYANSFVIRAVANPIGVAVNYNKNTEDAVSNMPLNASGNISDEYITVSDSTPSRSGYDFTGWCSSETKDVLNINYCEEDDKYASGDRFYMDRSESETEVNFYAMWKPAGSPSSVCNSGAASISEAVCMQDMNNNVKDSMAVDQQYWLIDIRDGRKYWIAKMQDGNVWMTQNLDYVLDDSVTLTHANTDLGWTNYDTNAAWTPAIDTLTEENGDTWEESIYFPWSFRSNDVNYFLPATSIYEEYTDSLEECVKRTGSKEQCEHFSTGTYYNWASAVATNNVNNGTIVDGYTAPDSVCPAGWRLPNGGDRTEFYNQLEAYNMSSISGSAARTAFVEGAPFYYIRAGVYEEYNYPAGVGVHRHRDKGEFSFYWTSKAHLNQYAMIWQFDYNNGGGNNTWQTVSRANSVRCVARDKVTVSFDANGGTGSMQSQDYYGDASLPQNSFTYTNKGFVGWNTEADGTGTDYENGATFATNGQDEEVTLYAQWGEQTEIVYDGNGADSGSTATQYVIYGDTATISDSRFVKADRVFLYWNTSSDGNGTKYNPGDTFEATNAAGEKVTLYAIWQTTDWTATVNYVYDGNTNTVKYDRYSYQELVTKVSHTENIDDTGKKLYDYGNSWGNANIDGTDRGNKSEAHVLSFPGASSISVEVYYNGESTSWDWACVWSGSRPSYNASSNCTSTGYLSGKLGGSQGGTYTVNGNTLTNVGKWTRTFNSSNVTFGFKSDGGGAGAGYGYYAIASATMTKSGYRKTEGNYITPPDLSDSSFIGWTPSQVATTPSATNEQEVLDILYGTNTTYYAVYGKHTVFEFDENNGTGTMADLAVPYTQTASLTKNTFTRSGYIFTGWNTQADGSGTSYADEADVTAMNVSGETITLYAQWAELAEYTVNYYNGENANVVKYNCWTEQSVLVCGETPTSGEYAVPTGDTNDVFLGWNTNSSATSAIYTDEAGVKAAITGTTTNVYAIWAKPTILKFYANGGTGTMSDVVIKYGQTIYLPESGFAHNDAVFGKWNTQADGSGTNYSAGTTYSASNVAGATVDLYARWAYPTIIHFDANGGEGTMDTITVPYNMSINMPLNLFTKEGARFARWNKASDDSGTSYSISSTFTASNIDGDEFTLYAIWGYRARIIFDANGGEGTMDSIYADYNAYTYLPMNQFEKEGAVFAFWSKNTDGSGSTWSNGSSYWNSDVAGADVTLYAIWGYPTTLRFNSNGGTGTIDDIDIVYGHTAKMPSGDAFTKQDATFVNWNLSPDGTGTSYSVGSTYYTTNNRAGGVVNVYAKWRDFTIVNYDGNGADSGTMAYSSGDYNTTINLRQNTFVRNGYSFLGWNSAADGSGTYYPDQGFLTATAPNGEVKTLYAIWKPDYMPDPEGGGVSDGMTIARAYEIAYVAMGKGMYVPIKDGQGGYDTHNYKIAESGEDYDGIPANEYRFAMQDMTSEICSMATVSPSNVMTLDLRDNKSYWVTKLADGKCWMTQNLDLDLGAELTSDNTDLNVTAATGMYSTGYSSEQVGDRTVIKWQPTNTTVSLTSRTITNWTTSTTVAYSGDPGDWYQQGYTASNCDFFSGCTTNFDTTPDTNNNGTHGHVGNYYNVAAAYATDNYTSDSTSGNHWIPNSICPKGWRLPANQSSSSPNSTWEYLTLNGTYNSNSYSTDAGLVASPLYFTRAGYIYYSTSAATLYNTGLYGWYLMGLVNSYNSGFSSIMFSNTTVNQSTVARSEGYAMSVRCVAR